MRDISFAAEFVVIVWFKKMALATKMLLCLYFKFKSNSYRINELFIFFMLVIILNFSNLLIIHLLNLYI